MKRDDRKLSADSILQAIRELARELGRAPTRAEFTRSTGISHFRVQAHFPSLREAVRQAGLAPNPQGRRVATQELLRDWAAVARRLGAPPSRSQYLRHGRYSAGVFTLRFGSWTAVPSSFARFARDNDREEEWADVLRMVEQEPRHEAEAGISCLRSSAIPEAGAGLRFFYSKHAPGDGRVEQAFMPRIPCQKLCDQRVEQAFMPAEGGAREWGLGPGRELAASAAEVHSAPLPPPLAGQRRVTHLVLAMIANTLAPEISAVDDSRLPAHQLTPSPADFQSHAGFESARLLRDRPVLGAPLVLPGLAYAPVNEAGVVFLFGMMAHRLGFRVECMQSGFPDCEAVREISPGRWQRVRIEFEYESRNFLAHRHPAAECDLIVCWRHNWPDCPLEVVEMRKELLASSL